jgi:hypothetical protein
MKKIMIVSMVLGIVAGSVSAGNVRTEEEHGWVRSAVCSNAREHARVNCENSESKVFYYDLDDCRCREDNELWTCAVDYECRKKVPDIRMESQVGIYRSTACDNSKENARLWCQNEHKRVYYLTDDCRCQKQYDASGKMESWHCYIHYQCKQIQ